MQHYQGGPEIELIVVEGQPDINPIGISVYLVQNSEQIAEFTPTPILVSTKISVQELKDTLCRKLNVRFSKYDMSIIVTIEEGTPVYKSLSGYEDNYLEEAGIGNGTMICLQSVNIRIEIPYADSEREPNINAWENVEPEYFSERPFNDY